MPAPALLLVTYRLRVPVDGFRVHATQAAEHIVGAPGLRWKIWGLNAKTGEGTSVYLFDDRAAADAFAAGPAIQALKSGPAEEVTTRTAPIDLALSLATRASDALGSFHPGEAT